jgi:hypothetical protein
MRDWRKFLRDTRDASAYKSRTLRGADASFRANFWPAAANAMRQVGL